ncbi:hypothetical protein [Streptomyces sp. NPDC005955]|uniref:hypothetical protein n=1 Tax=Streptomyces sp. NPDC005955 TaxID=3364738 RepID=UPI00369469A6
MSQTDTFLRNDNPFPFSPVVQLGGFADAVRMGVRPPKRYPTIVTDELTRLRRQVADYLERPGPGGDLGRAVALVGDFGVGKSHMAREVTAAIRADASVPLWVINQPTLDLGVVYRNRMLSLRDDTEARIAFERVVSAYYANVVVELLRSSDAADLHIGPQHQAVIAGLSDGTFDPRKVIQAFGIDKELMHRHLREHLRVAVDHRKFAVGLSLLLEGDFKREVWDWLTAEEPSQALRDRGIGGAIDSTEAVFDALCVFSFLHGRVGQRYVLVVDALETVLSWPQRDRSEFMNGFEKLVNTYVNQDGLLVMCIQPEPWSRMPQGLHERVLQIWPTGLDETETARLISGYLRVSGVHDQPTATDRPGEDPQSGSGAARALDDAAYAADGVPTEPADYQTVVPPTDDDTGDVVTAPFAPDAVAEVAELSNGVPREILKICRQAWQLARDALAARIAATATPPDSATGPPGAAEAPADATVDTGATDGETLVDVSRVHEAVRHLYEQRAGADVLRTVERSLAQGQWRREAQPPELGDPPLPGTREIAYWVRVGAGAVLGVLPSRSVLEPHDVERIGRVTRAAHGAFPRGECEILVVANGYVSRRMRDRIAETTRTAPVVVTDTGFSEHLDHAVEVLARRLESAQRESTLDQVRARLGRVTAQQTGTLERIEQLDSRLERLALTPDRRPAADPLRDELPQPVRRLFAEAAEALDLLMGEPTDLRRSLGVDAAGMAPPDGRPQRVTFSAPQFQAIGVTTLVRMLLRAFRDGVGDWLTTVAGGDGGPTDDERNSLFVLCRSFEITVEVLPEIRPETLPPGPADPDRGTRELRSSQVAEVLSSLAERVQSAVLGLVTNGRNGGAAPSAAAH